MYIIGNLKEIDKIYYNGISIDAVAYNDQGIWGYLPLRLHSFSSKSTIRDNVKTRLAHARQLQQVSMYAIVADETTMDAARIRELQSTSSKSESISDTEGFPTAIVELISKQKHTTRDNQLPVIAISVVEMSSKSDKLQTRSNTDLRKARVIVCTTEDEYFTAISNATMQKAIATEADSTSQYSITRDDSETPSLDWGVWHEQIGNILYIYKSVDIEQDGSSLEVG